MILRKLDWHYHVWEYSIERKSPIIYQTSKSFKEGQISVYLNGLKLEKGAGKDYIELLNIHNQIQFNYEIDVNDIVSVEFIEKII